MGTLTAGNINMFTGTWDDDATGFRLTADEICGQNAGTDQVIIQTSDGKLTAGAGDVVLDADGLAIMADDTNWFRWLADPGEGGGVVAQMRARYWLAPLGVSRLDIEVVGRGVGGDDGQLIIKAQNSTGTEYSQIELHSVTGMTLTDPIVGTKTLNQLSTYEFFPLLNPWTSASWDGDDKADTTGTLIDVSADFGQGTTGIVAYLVRISGRGSGAGYFTLAPQSDASAEFSVIARPSGSGVFDDGSGIVPADGNGDLYYASSACDQHWFQIFGYWKMP